MPVAEIQELITLAEQDLSHLSDSDVTKLRHPEYDNNISNWFKWRLTYESGEEFLSQYLIKFSKRESDSDFTARKNVSYVPAFGKAGVNDIKNSIFQRISDVTREGGPSSYLQAINGLDGGVDLSGSTMNSYVGRIILPELLSMKKVGIFVDMPPLGGPTILDKGSNRPYIYAYLAEDILNWTIKNSEVTSLLLRDHIFQESFGLPVKVVERYRLMWRRDNVVFGQFFDGDGKRIGGLEILNLPSIPFVLFELSESLLKDVANYQIALLNLASSDISYSLKSNFPFYVEQYDPRVDNVWARAPRPSDTTQSDGVTIVKPATATEAAVGENKEIAVGVASGRRVPKGLDYPEFRHPSSEPLRASMDLQDSLKKDIRLLINLAVTNLTPKMASAESKGFDERSLEAGLSYIGLELEHGERNIAKFWTWYENRNGTVSTVRYPEKYQIRIEHDKREEVKELLSTAETVPSITYKKEALKRVVMLNVGAEISNETLNKIQNEIDKADTIFSNPDTLAKDIEQGLISLESASNAKTYPKGEVEKAKADHAERIKRIAESQAQARGTPDLGGLANTSRSEKQDSDMKGTVPEDDTRGEGK